MYDYRIGKKIAMPSWAEDILRKASAVEEESRRHWEARRRDIESALNDLEGETTESGKVEDTGSKPES